MEQEAEDDHYYDGAYDGPIQLTKEQILEKRAKNIYNELINDDELMHKVNVLLRKNKLEQLKNK